MSRLFKRRVHKAKFTGSTSKFYDIETVSSVQILKTKVWELQS